MNDASASVLPMGRGRKQRVKEGIGCRQDGIGLIFKKRSKPARKPPEALIRAQHPTEARTGRQPQGAARQTDHFFPTTAPS